MFDGAGDDGVVDCFQGLPLVFILGVSHQDNVEVAVSGVAEDVADGGGELALMGGDVVQVEAAVGFSCGEAVWAEDADEFVDLGGVELFYGLSLFCVRVGLYGAFMLGGRGAVSQLVPTLDSNSR